MFVFGWDKEKVTINGSVNVNYNISRQLHICTDITYDYFMHHDSLFFQSGVEYIVSPAGSTNDMGVVKACDEHNMVIVHSNVRLFHH